MGDADKKKADEVLEAIRKARKAEFEIKEETKPTGIIGFTENEIALIGIVLLEKMENIMSTMPTDPLEALKNLSMMADCNAVKDKIDKILNINR